MGLFERLRDAALPDWDAYVAHPFVSGLIDGTLPRACFQRYLVQDYLFLIHFARAFALAAFKSDTLADLADRAATLHALTQHEMGLHVEYCASWGISRAEIEAAPEARETMAYTRYVLERGLAGDVLDLEVALAPCTIGYGAIGRAALADPCLVREGNPYMPWIAMYSGAEYLAVADGAVARLDRIWAQRGSEARMPQLTRTFAEACRLEAAFWQMGFDADPKPRERGGPLPQGERQGEGDWPRPSASSSRAGSP
jgi:thiaminase/transcriptional activator TenA